MEKMMNTLPLTCSSFLLVVLLLISLCPCTLRPVMAGDDDDNNHKWLGSKFDKLTCAHKLISCRPFLDRSLNPPRFCCDPLKEMLDDKDCFCNLYNDTPLLDELYTTKYQLSHLPKHCGYDVQPESLCKNSTAGPWASKSSPSNVSGVSPPYMVIIALLIAAAF